MMKKITEHYVTDEAHYLNRRNFIKQSAGLGVGLATFSAFSNSVGGGKVMTCLTR